MCEQTFKDNNWKHITPVCSQNMVDHHEVMLVMISVGYIDLLQYIDLLWSSLPIAIVSYICFN